MVEDCEAVGSLEVQRLGARSRLFVRMLENMQAARGKSKRPGLGAIFAVKRTVLRGWDAARKYALVWLARWRRNAGRPMALLHC